MTEPGVLVLGGTAEGRDLADRLSLLGLRVVSSLAGRVSAPRLPTGEVRVGGFGGAAGLAEYLLRQSISAVVDATHPFATEITANAVTACRQTRTPFLLLHRPAWRAGDGDRWTSVPDLRSAEKALADFGPDAVVLLTVGRQGVSAFANSPHRFWLRAVDPPERPLPARHDLVLDRGPFTLDGERDLLRRLEIDVLITKNSGGEMTVAKLTAARELGLPVVVVDRPPTPLGVRIVSAVPTAVTWTRGTLARH